MSVGGSLGEDGGLPGRRRKHRPVLRNLPRKLPEGGHVDNAPWLSDIHSMPDASANKRDWYDRLITLLGLDECRNDRILGISEQDLGPTNPAWREARAELCRLPDGTRQVVLRFRTTDRPAIGLIRCDQANARTLGQFLSEAERRSPIKSGEPSGAPGILASIAAAISPKPVIVGMDPLPAPHPLLRFSLELRSARHLGPCLRASFRGRGGIVANDAPWNERELHFWRRIEAALD